MFRYLPSAPRCKLRRSVATCLAAALAGCAGAARPARPAAGPPPAAYYARRYLVVGRLPNQLGFGIWTQRYRSAGRDYVQIGASTVPAARSMAQIRSALDSDRYGLVQADVGALSDPVSLAGVVGCSRRPAVLLYALVHVPVGSAVLRVGVLDQPFNLVAVPRDLGVNAALGYGFLTAPAALRMRSPAGALIFGQALPGPPPYQACAGASMTIQYASAPPGFSPG